MVPTMTRIPNYFLESNHQSHRHHVRLVTAVTVAGARTTEVATGRTSRTLGLHKEPTKKERKYTHIYKHTYIHTYIHT